MDRMLVFYVTCNARERWHLHSAPIGSIQKEGRAFCFASIARLVVDFSDILMVPCGPLSVKLVDGMMHASSKSIH